jgi:hypothetical protein
VQENNVNHISSVCICHVCFVDNEFKTGNNVQNLEEITFLIFNFVSYRNNLLVKSVNAQNVRKTI